MLVPYEKAVWVYLTVRKTNGITTGKQWNFCMADGKKFRFEANEEELLWFLNNYRANFSGKLIFGYSAENEKMYRQLVKHCKN